jgi:hypothetical protein
LTPLKLLKFFTKSLQQKCYDVRSSTHACSTNACTWQKYTRQAVKGKSHMDDS